MVFNQVLKQLAFAALLAGVIAPATAAVEGAVCGLGSEECLSSCKRFKEADPRRSACNNVCQPKASRSAGQCSTDVATTAAAPGESTAQGLSETSSEAVNGARNETPNDAVTEAPNAESSSASSQPESAPAESSSPDQPQSAAQVAAALPAERVQKESAAQAVAAPAPDLQPTKGQPKIASISIKREMMKEIEKNTDMLAAIKAGNLNAIRRLIETQGLSPTYVYGYDYNPQTRLFEGRVTRLRLSDVFADNNTLRNDAAGLDRIQGLFLELGMDVKATIIVAAPTGKEKNAPVVQREITAWGPSLKLMYAARDRDARLRAFEMTLQAGLVPNEDFGEWLFAELPQVCGRDKSKFSIQVVDLLIKYLLPTLNPPSAAPLQDYFWRTAEHGPETIADVLDHATAPAQPKNSYEKAQYAVLDDMWEQCVPLSRRINRFLVQGN